MLFGIGHDIVDNIRIAKLLHSYQTRFINKILSEHEYQNFMNITHETKKINYIAKRYAAKEAFSKACSTGLRYPIIMPNISILNDELGKPYFIFNEQIQYWLNKNNITRCLLSLSDEQQLSSAFVILEI